MGKKAAIRASSLVVPTLILVVVVLLTAVQPGSALDEAPLPPIGGDVQSVDTEGFYATYQCTGYDSESIDQEYLLDGVHFRYSWADGRMMYQIVGSGSEPVPFEISNKHRLFGLAMGSPGPWLPLDGSTYVVVEGWSEDVDNSPYSVDLRTYSDLIFEPGSATTLEEHGWEGNVVRYVGGYTYTRDQVDDDPGPTETTKERIGHTYNAWYHESTGLLLANDHTEERFQYETNYESEPIGHTFVRPIGVISGGECVLVDTNLNMSGELSDVPAAGVPSDGETPGDDEDEVDPAAQAAAAGATVLLAGGWLIAESVAGRRRRDEFDAATVPLSPTGPVPSDMVPTEEDRYWDERNRRERAAALRAHQRFSDDEWGKFTDRCRDRAAADRAAAAAERHDRQLRRTAADRLEDMATDKGYRDFVDFLDRQLKVGTKGWRDHLPSWDQLREMRNAIVKRVGDQTAIDKYNEKSDVRVFLEGCQDTAARGVGKVVGTAHGSIAGKGAEWAVRNPLVPARIGLAIATAGKSELVLLPFDAWDAMEAAADQKMAEQNRELTYWEATKEIIKTGAWHVGGELAGDAISKISQMRGGGAVASREAAEEAADAAARRASGRAGTQTGDDFVRRVEARVKAKIAAREAGEEIPDAAARRLAEVDEAAGRIGDSKRIRPDNWLQNHARPSEVIPRNHLHETGYTARDVRAGGRIGADEGVTFGARTTNMDSMSGVRDGTGVSKSLDIKSKTINEVDTYLGATKRGEVGFFEPTMPANIDELPPELRGRVLKRFEERSVEFKKMSKDPAFQQLLRDRVVEVKDGVVYNVATGKPYVGDIDLVYIKDTATGKYLTSGDRYERVMRRWRTEVGGQHGGEMTVVDDVTRGRRPGTPEYETVLEGAHGLQDRLQKAHLEGGEVVVEIGADGIDGVVRRGPIGADINLTPSADEILVEAAESVPPAGGSGLSGEMGGVSPPQGAGGAVGSTMGRELEGTPDA